MTGACEGNHSQIMHVMHVREGLNGKGDSGSGNSLSMEERHDSLGDHQHSGKDMLFFISWCILGTPWASPSELLFS